MVESAESSAAAIRLSLNAAIQASGAPSPSIDAASVSSNSAAAAHVSSTASESSPTSGSASTAPLDNLITEGNWKRNTTLPPPSVADAQAWHMVPGTLICDAAPASATATKDAFDLEDDDLDVVFCMAHARIGMNKEAPKIKDKKTNAKRMKSDFQFLQSSCLSVSLNDVSFKRMISY